MKQNFYIIVSFQKEQIPNQELFECVVKVSLFWCKLPPYNRIKPFSPCMPWLETSMVTFPIY